MKSAALHTTVFHLGSSGSLANHSDPSVDIQGFFSGLPGLAGAALKGDVLIIPDRITMTPIRRLVVLIPEGEIDENTLARRIWQLGAGSSLDILFLAQAPYDHQEVYQRRRLASLAYMTSDREIQVQVKVSREQSWSRTLEETQLPGDLLICLENHQTPNHVIWRRPLGKFLSETASVPVYLLAGLKIGLGPYQRQRFNEILAWTSCLILLGAFSGLQIEIVRSTAETTSTLLLCLSVLAEVFLLYKINEWIG